MPLSEEEQKMLDQLEAALAAEDPRLASTMRGTPRRLVHRRQATLSGLGFLAGLGLLLAGIQTHPLVSVLGFLVMLVCTIIALKAWQPADHSGSAGQSSSPSRSDAHGDTAFMDKMEERWRRRQDEGF